MDTSALVRLVCLAISSYALQRSSTPPNPPASPEEQAKYTKDHKKRDVLGVSLPAFVFAMRVAVHSWLTAEAFVFAARELPLASLVSGLQPGGPEIAAWLRSLAQIQLYMSPETIVGFGMACTGAWIRVLCFRRLAKHFTFELSLKEGHKLITDGPYAIVRHPSYTGAVISAFGLALLQLGRGSLWYQRCLPGNLKWIGAAYLLLISFLALPAVPRSKVEDEVLSAHFGEEWQRWAQKTPYRLFPGIY